TPTTHRPPFSKRSMKWSPSRAILKP
ncbi:uncharacterized protein METZ01_LOCUS368426, partial [marine metagenome]